MTRNEVVDPERLRRRSVLLAGAACAFSRCAVAADDFPSKPIRVVVPYGAGGGLDLITRAVGERMSRELKQPFIIDNRAGANGIIATEAVAKSSADGYTLLVGVPSTIAINRSLYRSSVDTLRDLRAVSRFAVAHFVLAAAPSSGIGSIEQLLAQAKANPGKYSFASYGNGSAPHLAGQMLRSLAGIDLVHVPYKGSNAALPDVIKGRVTLIFDTVGNVQPYVASGQLKVLAAAGDRVPRQFAKASLLSASVPGLAVEGWVGLFAPSGTPVQVVQQLNAAATAALADPQLTGRLGEMGFEVAASSPQQLQDLCRTDADKYAKAIQSAGLRME
jgi:tripartite-type tricarboxylate transporter receptor subunit TctC